LFSFGKFSHEKRLAKALRQRPLDAEALQALKAAVNDNHRFLELPTGLLRTLYRQAEKAMQEVPEQSPLWYTLYHIFRPSVGEYENRFRAR